MSPACRYVLASLLVASVAGCSSKSESAADCLDRGISHYAKGDLDRAIADFTEAIRLQPNDDGAYFHRGMSYRAQDDQARADADLEKAGQLGIGS